MIKLDKKYAEQLKSLCISKDALNYKNENKKLLLMNLSSKSLTNSDNETLKYGLNMCWPSKINKQQLQIAYEAFFDNINKNCAITEANADNIKTTLKSHFNKFLSHKEKHKK